MAVLRLRYSSAVILLASAAALVAGTPPCPAGWSEGGFWCYLLNGTSTLSWAGAQALCSERGGRLVELPDRAHLLDVRDLVRANHVPDWWIGIKRTSDATHEQVISANNLFDNFGDDKVSPGSSSDSGYQCVYLSGRDGLWHWNSCDTAMHYICQKPASRVPILLVSPERVRPNAAWFASHARDIEAALYEARLTQSADDKGEFSASKAAITPIPPTATTMTSSVGVVTSSGGSPTEATTVTLCQGRHWLMLDAACYQLIMDAMNWTMASERCQQQGGKLATFRTADIQSSFVARFSHNSGSVWVGLRRDADGEVSWVDGSTPSFSGWPIGQPLSPAPAASCGALTLHTGDWSNQDCSAYKPFACHRSLDATSMATTPTTAPTTTAPSLCGAGGWWQYRQWCFLLVNDMTAVSWHAAQLDCRRRSANLAKIESSAENTNIFHRVTQSNLPVWIGLTRRMPPAHQYVWTDGTAASFTSWEHGYNNVADLSSCARMDNERGSWRAVNCNSPQFYVCQKPVGSPAPPPPPPPPQPSGGSCPEGWTRYGTDRCLLVFDRLADWSEARRTCRNEAPDGELVTIADPVQQAFVTDAIRHSVVPLWIGLTYIKVEHQFVTWTDESAVNYTKWAPGQPSNVCDDCPVTCGLLGSRRSHTPGAWSAVDCSQAFRFVCQRSAVTVSDVTDGTDGPDGQPLGADEPTRCPPPLANYLQDGDACLKVVRQPATWQAAAADCEADNTSLAYVGDVFDNARLMKLLYRDGGDQYWLALSDTKRYGIPQWSAPWPAEPTFTNWELRRPLLASPTTCAALRPDTGRWRHLACSQPQPYVCLRRPLAQMAPPATASRCPSSLWAASERRCYRLYEGAEHTRTWAEAKQACEEQQQQLAVVSSESDFLAVLEAISGLTNTFSAWIGGRQQPDTDSFVWVDGSAVAFHGWIKGEPSQKRRETCLEASKLDSGRWNNMRCTMYRPFVCMIDTSGAEEHNTASRLADGGKNSGGGWRVFGIVCLTVAALTALVGAAVLAVRRRLALPRHRRMSAASSVHISHDRENPAYSESEQPLDGSISDDDADGSRLNGGSWRALTVPSAAGGAPAVDYQEEHPL